MMTELNPSSLRAPLRALKSRLFQCSRFHPDERNVAIFEIQQHVASITLSLLDPPRQPREPQVCDAAELQPKGVFPMVRGPRH